MRPTNSKASCQHSFLMPCLCAQGSACTSRLTMSGLPDLSCLNDQPPPVVEPDIRLWGPLHVADPDIRQGGNLICFSESLAKLDGAHGRIFSSGSATGHHYVSLWLMHLTVLTRGMERGFYWLHNLYSKRHLIQFEK